MYEGQTIICQNIVEENWLEFLQYTKRKTVEQEEINAKRQKALAEIEPNQYPVVSLGSQVEKASDIERYRYYDINLNQFWTWYINEKVEVK